MLYSYSCESNERIFHHMYSAVYTFCVTKKSRKQQLSVMTLYCMTLKQLFFQPFPYLGVNNV